MIVYVSIGNSDDKLTQAEWARFYSETALLLQRSAKVVHGQWVSEPASAWQNACWCIEVDPMDVGLIEFIKAQLIEIAVWARQDSIAWAAVAETEFLRP